MPEVGSAFTTVAISADCTVVATFTSTATVPGAPVIGNALAANTQATINFAAPGSDGGSAILSYAATSSPGNITGTCTAPCTSITVIGLNNGTAYTFTVKAINSVGTSAASAGSGSVTPTAPQAITFGAQSAQTYAPAAPFTLNPLATASSTMTVAYSSNTSGVCTVNVGSGLVTIISAGTCTIAADQAGNGSFGAAPQVTQSFAINKAGQAALIAASTLTAVNVGQTATLSTSGGSGTGAVSFASNNGNCTVSGVTLTAAAAGNCIITGTKAADTNYLVATATVNVSTSATAQTITFGTAPSVTVGATGVVAATGGASNNPVVFTSNTATICTVSGSVVTGIALGTCTIAANQSGNTTYAAAPEVTQNISVAITTYSVTPTAGANGTINPAVPQTVSSGATFVFSVIPNNGYSASIAGTCGGRLIGTTYTTNAITAACSVIASFAATATAASTTTLASNLNPSNFGRSVTLTATASGSNGAPTGTVVFRDGDNVLVGCSAVALSGGVAQCVTSTLPMCSIRRSHLQRIAP